MEARRFVTKHNYRINLCPMQPNTEYYHPVFEFLRRSRVNYVLTNSPILYLTYIEQFWNTTAYDSNVTPPVIRATVADVNFEFSAADLREILHLGTVEQEAGPTSFSRVLRGSAFRRMGYVGDITKNTYFKTDLYGHWRYLAHVLLVALSNKKTGWDTLNVETQSQVIALTYNKPYNFSQFFFNKIRDQIGAGAKERFLMYPRFVMMIINSRIPNLPPVGHVVEVAGLDKRVYKDITSFTTNKPAERRAQAVALFGALVNPAYQAPPNDGWEDVVLENQPEGAAGAEQAAVAGAEAAQAQPQAEVQQQQEVAEQAQAQDQQVPPEAELINDVLDQMAHPQADDLPVHPVVVEEIVQDILQTEDVFVQIENYDANTVLDDIGMIEDFGPNEGQVDDVEVVEAFDSTRDEAMNEDLGRADDADKAADEGDEDRDGKRKRKDTDASEESDKLPPVAPLAPPAELSCLPQTDSDKLPVSIISNLRVMIHPTAQATSSQPLPPVAPLAPPAELSCLPQTGSDKLPAYFQIHVPGLPILAEAAENAPPHFDSSQQSPPPTAQATSSQSLPPVAPSVLPAEPLSPPQTDSVELQVSSPQCGTICVQGYNVKRSFAPILEAIFKKHGDIAAECLFKTASVRSNFLEVVCEVVTRIETDDVIEKMEEVECQVSDAEAANINVSWLRAHLEAVHKRKEAIKRADLLMETKVNTSLVKRAAQRDLRERCEELMTAQERFEKAERCARVLHLVEKNIKNTILDTKAENDSRVKRRVL